jgi:plasmid stabilization system protein ParE
VVAHQPFKIIYAPQTKSHLKAIERKNYTLIRNTIDAQWRFEPLIETKNRKPLSRPVEFEANWELRFGPDNRFRVFYEVSETDREVRIIALGVKRRNKVFIGGQEVEL